MWAPLYGHLRRRLKPFPVRAEMQLPTVHLCRAMSHTRIEWDSAVVLSVARNIEPDQGKVMRWFDEDRINELGGKTAKQLVEEGATAQLLDMLVAIRNGRRGC